MVLRWLAVGLLVLFPQVAASQTCSSYLGQRVSLTSFDHAAAILEDIPLWKDEYETTPQFEQRVHRAVQLKPHVVIIEGIFSPQYVKYDADKGVLRIESFALRTLNTDYAKVFGYGSRFDGRVEFAAYSNLDVVVAQSETKTGSYTASNAYGAERTVTEITRVQKAIFERKAQGSWEKIFASQLSDRDPTIGEIAMTAAEAMAIKVGGKVAFVASPKWPYFASGTKTWDPTISRPTDVTNYIHVIVADLQCALLLSHDDKVLAAFELR